MQSAAYCALNRHYVAPELKKVLFDLSAQMDREYPGTTTLILDANFPFISGFPLLPHLSHSDGQKVDLAFFYQKDGTYLPGKTNLHMTTLDAFDGEQNSLNIPLEDCSINEP